MLQRGHQDKKGKRIFRHLDFSHRKDTTNDLRLILADSLEINRHTSVPVAESLPVLSRDIRNRFGMGKQPSSYAIIMHVKQPISGKRKAFCHFNNVDILLSPWLNSMMTIVRCPVIWVLSCKKILFLCHTGSPGRPVGDQG